jgi:hypothetical protein
MRFITSGTGIREIVDQRPDASSAPSARFAPDFLQKTGHPGIDADGHSVSLEKLRRLADAEGREAGHGIEEEATRECGRGRS